MPTGKGERKERRGGSEPTASKFCNTIRTLLLIAIRYDGEITVGPAVGVLRCIWHGSTSSSSGSASSSFRLRASCAREYCSVLHDCEVCLLLVQYTNRLVCSIPLRNTLRVRMGTIYAPLTYVGMVRPQQIFQQRLEH